VPCFKRVKSVEYVDDDEMMVDGGDTGEWVDTFHSQRMSRDARKKGKAGLASRVAHGRMSTS
jgi:hypothetical protein